MRLRLMSSSNQDVRWFFLSSKATTPVELRRRQKLLALKPRGFAVALSASTARALRLSCMHGRTSDRVPLAVLSWRFLVVYEALSELVLLRNSPIYLAICATIYLFSESPVSLQHSIWPGNSPLSWRVPLFYQVRFRFIFLPIRKWPLFLIGTTHVDLFINLG